MRVPLRASCAPRVVAALVLLLLGVASRALADAAISITVTLEQVSAVHHYVLDVIPASPEPQGGDLVEPVEHSDPLPFLVRVEARDAAHALVPSYSGMASLTSSVGSAVPGSITFTDGVWEGQVTILGDLDPPCYLTVTEQANPSVTGTSATFDLRGKGDPTNDGAVNVFDVLRTVNIALGRVPSEPPRFEFQFWAADMNRDGVVNVFDVIQVVNKSLGRTAALAAATGATAPSAGLVEVTVAPARGGAWAIRVSNAAGLAGAQFEIACKQGEVAAGELAAAAGWQVQSNWVNGRLRVIAYSPSATGLTASEGPLLLLSDTRGRPRLASVLLSDAAGRAIPASWAGGK